MAYSDEQKERAFAMQQIIKNLRADDLKQGHCFMIFDDELPEEQAYYEYPDGHINIEQIDKQNIDNDRIVIKILNSEEVEAVKEKHEVFH